jgi:CubicO group peptidase (beta-lactamase class C family)
MRTLDQTAVRKLVERARREVDSGLLPSCQLALGLDGELVLDEAIGDAGPDTRYLVFSATKPFVAATLWVLIGEGLVDPALPVVEYVPGFGTNGKDVVTVEQVMLHTSGFPGAPLAPLAGSTGAGRRAAFARWRLNWEPGSRYEYHPTSAHWVLAEIIEQVTGADFRDVVADRVTGAAGLPRVLGALPWQAATLVPVGGLATPDELEAAFRVRELPVTEVTTDALLAFNDPAVQAVGVPGGGGVMRASDLARFYQAVLRNPGELWRPDVLADAVGHVRNRLPDPLTGAAANRTLGLIQAGDDGLAYIRGFGRTVSPSTVGHNGAGGQLAWADPATGLSFAYCTNGLDEHAVRVPRRGTALSSLAAVCVTG